jgi:hypothetical protein
MSSPRVCSSYLLGFSVASWYRTVKSSRSRPWNNPCGRLLAAGPVSFATSNVLGFTSSWNFGKDSGDRGAKGSKLSVGEESFQALTCRFLSDIKVLRKYLFTMA